MRARWLTPLGFASLRGLRPCGLTPLGFASLRGLRPCGLTPLGLALVLLAGGCASGQDELARVRVENELLREQIKVVRQNCEHYRKLRLEADESEEPEAPEP